MPAASSRPFQTASSQKENDLFGSSTRTRTRKPPRSRAPSVASSQLSRSGSSTISGGAEAVDGHGGAVMVRVQVQVKGRTLSKGDDEDHE